jgi:hypothetical protein
MTQCSVDAPVDTDDAYIDGCLQVRAHLEYSNLLEDYNKVFAISDSGADSCVLGKHAHIIHYTGRYAHLVGYDPANTRSGKIPIVSAYLKVKAHNNIPILLRVNEAPHNGQSPVTLLSEYQIREFGLVIDSVAVKHKASHGHNGTQHFNSNDCVNIPFLDRGGMLGFELLLYEKGDDELYDVITITREDRWRPIRFCSENDPLSGEHLGITTACNTAVSPTSSSTIQAINSSAPCVDVTTKGADVTLVDPVLAATPILRSLNVKNDHHTSPSKHTPEQPSNDVNGIFHGDHKHVLPSYDPGDVHMPAYGKSVTLALNERSILSSTVDQFIQHLTFDELIRSNEYNSEYDGYPALEPLHDDLDLGNDPSHLFFLQQEAPASFV